MRVHVRWGELAFIAAASASIASCNVGTRQFPNGQTGSGGAGGCTAMSECDDGQACPIDTPCPNGAGYCDGTGQCVECNKAEHCTASDDPCEVASCTDHVCGFTNVADETPVPGMQQPAAECHAWACIGGVATDLVDDFNGVKCDGDTGTCVDGKCKHGPGHPCGDDASLCATAVCEDGVCCSTLCDGACYSCDLPGVAGTCLGVPGGMEDADSCSGTCTVGGSCTTKRKNGEMCSLASQCGSFSCVGGVCKQPNGTACAGASDCCSNSCVDNVCKAVAIPDFMCDGNPNTN